MFLLLAVLLYLTFVPTSPLAALHIGGLSERVVILWRDLWYAVLGWQFFKSAASAEVSPLDQRGRRLSPHRGTLRCFPRFDCSWPSRP
jgi:hypothetical protein